MHDKRIKSRTLLRRENFGCGRRIERITSQSVNRFGRHRDHFPGAQEQGSLLSRAGYFWPALRREDTGQRPTAFSCWN